MIDEATKLPPTGAKSGMYMRTPQGYGGCEMWPSVVWSDHTGYGKVMGVTLSIPSTRQPG